MRAVVGVCAGIGRRRFQARRGREFYRGAGDRLPTKKQVRWYDLMGILREALSCDLPI